MIAVHDLIKQVYEKFPRYVHFDIRYSTEKDGSTLQEKQKCYYNIYTPILGHNNFCNLEDLKVFIRSIISEGSIDIKIKLLQNKLERAERDKEAADNQLEQIKDDVKRLEEMEEFKAWKESK